MLLVGAAGCSSEREAAKRLTTTKAAVESTKTSNDLPLTASMEATPGGLMAGRTFQIVVHVTVADAHYIYATNSIGKPFVPTTLDVTFPAGVEAAGPWILPEATRRRNGDLIYTDSISFVLPARLKMNIPSGRRAIAAKLLYQACTEELCWPPRTLELSASIDVHPIKR